MQDRIIYTFNAQQLRDEGVCPIGVEFDCQDGGVAFVDILQIMFTSLENMAQDLIAKTPKELRAPAREEFYDMINTASSNILDMIMPDGISVSDAAVLKAQDDLVEEAYNLGIPVEQLVNDRYKSRVSDLDKYKEEREKVIKERKDSERAKALTKNVGRNEPCPCGSGKKFKHCCLNDTNVVRRMF